MSEINDAYEAGILEADNKASKMIDDLTKEANDARLKGSIYKQRQKAKRSSCC